MQKSMKKNSDYFLISIVVVLAQTMSQISASSGLVSPKNPPSRYSQWLLSKQGFFSTLQLRNSTGF
jgi:hypothetical protein